MPCSVSAPERSASSRSSRNERSPWLWKLRMAARPSDGDRSDMALHDTLSVGALSTRSQGNLLKMQQVMQVVLVSSSEGGKAWRAALGKSSRLQVAAEREDARRLAA